MKVCLFDGHIRNHAQLCEELGISSPEKRVPDSAVLEAGFSRWGTDIGNHLYGSFALAIQDEKSGALFCARDTLGIKPFYYGFDSAGALQYGSALDEVAAKACTGLDAEALQRYMMFGYPVGEKTLYAGVKKLMPGHYLLYDQDGCVVRPYHDLVFQPDHSRSEAQWAADIERVLQDVLHDDAEKLASDASCAFLSSGVDSSYLLALSGVRRACGIGYDEQGASEAKAAAEFARGLGVAFEENKITSDMFFDAVPRLIRFAGLPLADASSVALLLGCEAVARTSDCCLSGEGADELFAGYHVYRRADELGRIGAPRYLGCAGILEQESARRLLMHETSYSADSLVGLIYEKSESWEHLSRLQAIDCALWLEGDILLGANAASRASGLELLMPYADARMVDLATRIPAGLRLKEGCGKYILRKTAQGQLPHEVAFRPKIGFSVPMCSWMREARHREKIDAMLFGEGSASLFDTALVRGYWTAFLEGNDVLWQVVYALYTFMIWYRQCFSRLPRIIPV